MDATGALAVKRRRAPATAVAPAPTAPTAAVADTPGKVTETKVPETDETAPQGETVVRQEADTSADSAVPAAAATAAEAVPTLAPFLVGTTI
jgi:hypothetical protein